MIDGSQHHHVCTSDGRLVSSVQQLEVLVERILHQIDEFHMTFINEVIFHLPFILSLFLLISIQVNKINLHIL